MKRWPLLLLLAALPARGREALTTLAERSGFLRTGRYDEVLALCPAFARAYPGRASCLELGLTPEGRPMMALAVSADGTLTASAAREKGRPVVLVIAGIHAGEIDGKDAGFQVLREALEKKTPGLGAVTVLFVPVFNVDGHERFGPQQRPNQRGPAESGYRRTAQELNLNRDWVKAETPEMAAMLALVNAFDPALMVDLHVTDGAKFEHDVAVLVSPETESPPALVTAGHRLSTTLLARLRAQNHLPLDFYPAFRDEDDPASGVDAIPLPPRYSNGYFGARNRLGLLVETHSWRPYAYRVRTMRDILNALLEMAPAQAASWREAGRAADAEGERLGGTEVTLAYEAKKTPRTVDFRGYAYKREPSTISGAPWVEYDERRPQLWRLPVYDDLAATLVARAPRAGYLVPPAHAAWVARKLDLHGLHYQKLDRALHGPMLAFRADSARFSPVSVEGRQPLKLTGSWRPEPRALAAGALFVPIAQPRARLVMHLLEPTAPDSLAAWGFFQTAFEPKEGMESYVVEAEARRMLAADRKLRADFEAALRDPDFAKDPKRRLDFFRRRHPSWNEGFNLYPVLGLDARP